MQEDTYCTRCSKRTIHSQPVKRYNVVKTTFHLRGLFKGRGNSWCFHKSSPYTSQSSVLQNYIIQSILKRLYPDKILDTVYYIYHITTYNYTCISADLPASKWFSFQTNAPILVIYLGSSSTLCSSLSHSSARASTESQT